MIRFALSVCGVCLAALVMLSPLHAQQPSRRAPLSGVPPVDAKQRDVRLLEAVKRRDQKAFDLLL